VDAFLGVTGVVYLQWPLKRGKKKHSMSQALEQQTKIEAGFTQIKGTEFLMKRIEATDDFFETMSGVLEQQVETLLKKPQRSVQDESLLQVRTKQLMNLEAYRQLKKTGMAWSVAKDDNDMSERYSAMEKIFARNWGNPKYQDLIMASLWYLTDISFANPHVEPSPTLLVQNPVGGQRITLEGFGHEQGETAKD
jgi:hypothetical protein